VTQIFHNGQPSHGGDCKTNVGTVPTLWYLNIFHLIL